MLSSALVALALAYLPGGVLAFALPRGRARWVAWASAPLLSLGLTAFGMAWLHALRLPSSAAWVFGVEVIVAVLGAAAGVISRNRGQRQARSLGWTWSALRPRFPARLDLVLLGGCAVLAVGFGQLLVGRFREPPGWDAMNHGILVRNILDGATTAFTSVCTSGSTVTTVSCHFYPLAGDVSWAQIASVNGGHVGAAMSAWAVVIAPLVLVSCVFVAVRTLGGRPLVAAAAALATVLIGPLFETMTTGRVTEEVGPGLSVGFAVLAALALRGTFPIRLGLLAGLGGAGLAMTHTYDVLFGVTLAVALAVAIPGRPSLRTPVLATGAIVLGVFGTIGPIAGPLLGAGSERGGNQPFLLHQYFEGFRYWVLDFNRYLLFGYPTPGGGHPAMALPVRIGLYLAVVCLLASPLCFVFAGLRWARPWFAMWLLWTVIGIWTSTSNSGPAMFLSGLWYGVRERERAMIGPVYGVLVVAGAAAIGYSLQWAAARARVRVVRLLPQVAVAAVALALLALALTPSARRPLRLSLAARAPQSASYERVYSWLAQHTPKGDVVAYDRHLEYMTWSFADHGVGTLFGMTPAVGISTTNYDQRWAAFDWLVDDVGARPAGCEVQRFRIAYLAVGGPRVPGWGAHYSRVRIAKSPNLQLVHTDGLLRVYKVTPRGSACPSGSAAPATG